MKRTKSTERKREMKTDMSLPELVPWLERLKRGEALRPEEQTALARLKAVLPSTQVFGEASDGSTAPKFDDACLRLLAARSPELQLLSLNDTGVTDLGPLSGLTGLRFLTLDNTGISDLGPLSGLTELKTMWLNHTGVTDLAPLSGLTGLQILHLNSTGVTDLEPLSSLTDLHELYLNNTDVKNLEPLSGLKELQILHLNNTGVTDLRPLSDLTELQALYLKDTNVADLWPLSGLTALQTIWLNNTDVSDLGPLSGMLGLQTLYFDDTGVTDLRPLSGLTELQALSMNHTGVTDLGPLSGLTELQALYLNHTGVTDLAPLSGLNWLSFLYCRGLTLDRIPEALVRRSPRLDLTDSVLRQQPAALFRLPAEQILAVYYSQSLRPVREGKVIFLGDSDVGKTHTIHRLRAKGAPGQYDTKSTPGIEISSFDCEDGTGILFWDFGGQEIMHAMHRCFLTERTCYVVVVSNREANSAMPQAVRWLRSLAGYSDRISVLLAVNQWNNVREDKNIDRQELEAICPALSDVIFYSALDDSQEAFNEKITETIAREVRRLDSVRLELPESWAAVRDELQEMKEHYITLKDYREICARHGLDGMDEDMEAVRMWLLEWFNDLGVCFSYHKRALATEPELADNKVLDPRWLTNGIYRIINNGGRLAGNGFISRKDILTVLNERDGLAVDASITYAPEERNYILEVMHKFERAYPEKAGMEEDGMEFIPGLLQGKRPRQTEPRGFDFVLSFCLELTYLPPELIHRLMIGMLDRCDGLFWKNGVRLCDGDAALLVESKDGTLQMDLYRRQGTEPPAFCELFHEARRMILRFCREMSLRIERQHVVGRRGNAIADYDLENLLECRKNNVFSVPGTKGGFLFFTLEELLYPIFSQRMIDAALKLYPGKESPIQALDQLSRTWPWATKETLSRLFPALQDAMELRTAPLRALAGKLSAMANPAEAAAEQNADEGPGYAASLLNLARRLCESSGIGRPARALGSYGGLFGDLTDKAVLLALLDELDGSLLPWLRENGVMAEAQRPGRTGGTTPNPETANPVLERKMLDGVNRQLYCWAIRSPLYAAAIGRELRGEDETLAKALGPSETHRYIASQKLLEEIWAARPGLGLAPPYGLLTEREFGHAFYAGYRDHLTHMFKVFLLGLYFYEKHPKLRGAFDAAGIGSETFLPTWTLTALSHDVGYLFETKVPNGDGAEAKEVFAILTGMLSTPLSRLLAPLFTEPAERQMQRTLRSSGKMIPAELRLLNELEDKLTELADAGVRAGLGDGGNPVKAYYEAMFRPGESRSYYDHGVISACILLWMREKLLAYVEESRAAMLNERQKDARDKLLDDLKALEPAARTAAAAVALHNVTKSDEARKEALYHVGVTVNEFCVRLDADPFAYLLRLCDELQCWDRQRYGAPKPGEKGYLQGGSIGFDTDEEDLIQTLEIPDTDTKLKIQKALDGTKTVPGFLDPPLAEILPLR